LERIYATPRTKETLEKERKEWEEKAQYKEMELPHGRIVTRQEGEGYIIERINSTDMSDYLNADYSPGKSYKRERQ
jgi:DNA polymerase I-like protein with 3'-5' exonuclease and polymerase domains